VESKNSKMAQLCSAYDLAQEASRDPSRSGSRDYHLRLVTDTRRGIEAEAGRLLREIPDPPAVAELTYFNTWFVRRGGWSA
jgi:hypothetical protein